MGKADAGRSGRIPGSKRGRNFLVAIREGRSPRGSVFGENRGGGRAVEVIVHAGADDINLGMEVVVPVQLTEASGGLLRTTFKNDNGQKLSQIQYIKHPIKVFCLQCGICATRSDALPLPHHPRLLLEKILRRRAWSTPRGEPLEAGPLEAWKARLVSYSISAANSAKLSSFTLRRLWKRP